MGMTPQSLPPVPGSAQAPPEPEPSPPLASPPQEAPQAGNEVRNRAQTLMRQLMEYRRGIEGLAAQYPAGAKDARTAAEAIKNFMLKVMKEVQSAPGSSPSPPAGPG